MKSVSFEHFLAFTTQYLFLASLLDSQSLANRTDNLKIPTKSCDFKRCLCSYNRASDRHYLYCNDPDTVTLPDFSINNRSSLTFAKLDFTNSGIRNISGRIKFLFANPQDQSALLNLKSQLKRNWFQVINTWYTKLKEDAWDAAATHRALWDHARSP